MLKLLCHQRCQLADTYHLVTTVMLVNTSYAAQTVVFTSLLQANHHYFHILMFNTFTIPHHINYLFKTSNRKIFNVFNQTFHLYRFDLFAYSSSMLVELFGRFDRYFTFCIFVIFSLSFENKNCIFLVFWYIYLSISLRGSPWNEFELFLEEKELFLLLLQPN